LVSLRAFRADDAMLQVGRGARGRGAVVIARAAVVTAVVVLPSVPLRIIITPATGAAVSVTAWLGCASGARRAVVRLAGVALLAVEREITTVVTGSAEIT
jgi:hypothetical protein